MAGNRDVWSLADKPYFEAMQTGNYRRAQSELVDYCRKNAEDSDDDTISCLSIHTRSSISHRSNAAGRSTKEVYSDFEAIPEEFRPRNVGRNLHEIFEKPVELRKSSTSHSQYQEEKKESTTLYSFTSDETRYSRKNSFPKDATVERNAQMRSDIGRSKPQSFNDQNDVLCEGVSKVSLDDATKKKSENRYCSRNTVSRRGRGRGRGKRGRGQLNHRPMDPRRKHEEEQPVRRSHIKWNDNLCSFQNTSQKNVRHFVKNVNEGNYSMKQDQEQNEIKANLRHAIGNAIIKGKNKSIHIQTCPSTQEGAMKENDMVIRHEINVIHTYPNDQNTKDHTNTDIKNTKAEGIDPVSDHCSKQQSTKVKEVVVAKKKFPDETNKTLQSLLDDGRNISDLIVGCQVAAEHFKSFYHEWIPMREKTLAIFEELADQVKNGGNKSANRIRDWADVISEGGKMISLVPHPTVSLAARIIASLSGLISGMYRSSSDKNARSNADFLPSFQADIDATSDVFMYAMQCDQQFQETCQAIETFYGRVQKGDFLELSHSGGDFFKRLVRLNPSHYMTFFKKLQILLSSGDSSDEIANAFCADFREYPGALSLISKLNWRYAYDGDFTHKVWEDICQQLQESTGQEMYHKIKGCICVLRKEHDAIARNFKELLIK